jgi:hypothetical protein
MQMKAQMRGDFLNQLKARAAKLKSMPTKVSARVVVPPELSWWYYQEFGKPVGWDIPKVAGTANTKTGAVAFPTAGGQVIADQVHHPGLRARHIVGNVDRQIREEFQEAVAKFIGSGGMQDPEGLRLVVLNATARAKELITQSMADQLPGEPPRPPVSDPAYADTQSGKLRGAKAADVYRALAKVIETSR